MKSTVSEIGSTPQFLDPSLPPYLKTTEPLEPEDIPLQLALLTMEVANQRMTLQRIADLLSYAASTIRPAPAEIADHAGDSPDA